MNLEHNTYFITVSENLIKEKLIALKNLYVNF